MSDSDENLPEKEADARRDEVVRRMLNTPPKPHPKPKDGRRRGRPVGT